MDAKQLNRRQFLKVSGATAAVDFLAGIDPGTGGSRRERLTHSLHSVHDHESALRGRMEEGLRALGDAVTVHSKANDRTPTLLLTLAGRDAREAQTHLAALDVVAPAGSFYAYEAFVALKLADPALRVGLAPYNNTDDVDRLLKGLATFL